LNVSGVRRLRRWFFPVKQETTLPRLAWRGSQDWIAIGGLEGLTGHDIWKHGAVPPGGAVPATIAERNGRLHGGNAMSEASKERTYSDAEIEARLKRDLPHWYLEGGWIRRRYRTHGWKGTLMVINTVGHLAEAAWHHPDITASYAWVEVRLQNHAAKGITDKDFELARKIEDVVQWQPGKEVGALEGTPEKDQRFAYIKYDA
jgi:4a-hydroxytetrahydrobiopterin dehydratase